MAKKVDNGTRGGSPADSTRSTEGSSQDPIILSDDESMGAESKTDYSDLSVDLRAKSDSNSPHVASSDNDSSIVDGAKLQLAADRLSLNVIKEAEDEGIDVFTKGDDNGDVDARSTKRSRPSAISYNNLASDSNVGVSELQDSQPNHAQSLQPG
ncbi:hypothetical protein G7Y89_g6479 [Cudoniella acicularis]|uniref:Uncharacterized protein n=1 Tax=Cudoniella acicularis TaxID=354080 RepID=A0A8H4RKF2_9HELO|nr:hypothetical protein G7Y89_g6479 [Cudoniella acicularis]